MVPMNKNGDSNNPNNYRLSNILESLVNSQLKSFLSEYSILSSNHSTRSAVTLVLNDLITSFDNRKYCAAIFIDLAKASDTVDHSLLVDRLLTTGYDKDARRCFQNTCEADVSV